MSSVYTCTKCCRRPNKLGASRIRQSPSLNSGEAPFDVYAAFYSEYGHPDRPGSRDARSWGDLEHIVALTHALVVDLSDLDRLPKFDPPTGMFSDG
jgi:hypothetical protein